MIDAPYHEQWPTRQATERVCGGSEAACRCLRLRRYCRDLRFCRQCHRRVCQARRAEIVSQGAVEGGDHIGHDLDGRVRGSGQKEETPIVATTRGSIRFGPKQKGGVNATVFSSRF
jgi:hypothetical protein